MKYDKDPGLQPGQLRYDCLLKTLTALKRFSSALATPPTELYAKMENICAETFNYTQDQKIGVSCYLLLFVASHDVNVQAHQGQRALPH